MKHRSELIYKLREHIEECHQRMVLISDVNNWIQIQQKELVRLPHTTHSKTQAFYTSHIATHKQCNCS